MCGFKYKKTRVNWFVHTKGSFVTLEHHHKSEHVLIRASWSDRSTARIYISAVSFHSRVFDINSKSLMSTLEHE